MQSGYAIEQVFLERNQGMFSFLVVSVAPSGKIRKETLTYPTYRFANAAAATQKLACHLAERGDIDTARQTRFRRSATMQDDNMLKTIFINEFTDCLSTL